MNLIPWFPALTTTGLLAAVLWLARESISARLTRSIQFQFDNKLEKIRSEFRSTEERLKADLREKEAEISALRSGSLSALASRQAAVDRRRLEAIDQLWETFNSYSAGRVLATSMGLLNFDEAAKAAASDTKARKAFELLGFGFDAGKIDVTGANKARPFVSPMAWAIFSAYQAVVAHAIMRWYVLKDGLGTKDFSNREAVEKLIVAALPHFKDFIGEYGPSGYYLALEALEARLLDELQAMLTSSETDKASLEQAAEIIRQANALHRVAAGHGDSAS